MKKRIAIFITILTTAIFMISINPGSAATGGIQWKGYDEGIAMAKAEKKKVFLYFHADWCGYCRKMDASTFKDNKVINYLTDNYVAIKVNSDKEKKVANDYGVRGLPTSWFLKASSEKLSSIPGYIDAKRLVSLLKYVSKDIYEKMSYRDFAKNLK